MSDNKEKNIYSEYVKLENKLFITRILLFGSVMMSLIFYIALFTGNVLILRSNESMFGKVEICSELQVDENCLNKTEENYSE